MPAGNQGEADAAFTLAREQLKAGSPSGAQTAYKALSLYKAIGDKNSEAQVLNILARHEGENGRSMEGMRKAELALDLFLKIDSKAGEASALSTIAYLQLRNQQHAEAVVSAQEALATAQRIGDAGVVASVQGTLVDAYVQNGQPGEALRAAMDGHAFIVNSEDAAAEVSGLRALTAAYIANADGAGAERAARDALAILKREGDRRGEAEVLQQMGEIYIKMNSNDDGLAAAKGALKIYRELGDAKAEYRMASMLSHLYGTAGMVEKAPNRSDALATLKEAAQALEVKDADAFKEAYQRSKAMGGLSDDDINSAFAGALVSDPKGNGKFLREHAGIGSGTGEVRSNIAVHEGVYEAFSISGIQYGPHYRSAKICCNRNLGNFEKNMSCGVNWLDEECAESWEYEVAFYPPIVDSSMHHNMGVVTITGDPSRFA